MEKSKFLMVRTLALVLIFGMLFMGCATTQHDVEISNVRNIREIYIRNAGTTNWGANMAGTLQDIDKSKFSDRVDIRVIDTNGIAYSKFDEPFDDAAFEISKQHYYGTGSGVLLGFGIAALALLGVVISNALGGGE